MNLLLSKLSCDVSVHLFSRPSDLFLQLPARARGPRVMAEEGSSETLPPASHSASLEGDSSRGASLPLPDCPLPCTEFAKRSSANQSGTGESQVRGLGPSSTPWQRVVRPPFAEDIPDTSTPPWDPADLSPVRVRASGLNGGWFPSCARSWRLRMMPGRGRPQRRRRGTIRCERELRPLGFRGLFRSQIFLEVSSHHLFIVIR